MKRITKLCSFMIVALILCSYGSMAFADGSWSTKAHLPVDERYAASGAVVNGKLYVVGGMDGWNFYMQNFVAAYDPLANWWYDKAPIPTPRVFSVAAAVDGKLYVIGGSSDGWCVPPSNVVEMYDPATNTWSTKARMIMARYAPSIGVIDGKIYVAGGGIDGRCWLNPNGHATDSVEVYDPRTDTWTMLASRMPTGRYNASYGVINGKLYVAGGWSDHLENALEAYDPASDSWLQKAPMPAPRQDAAGDAINEQLYVAGGYNASIGNLNDLLIYNAPTDTWTTATATMPTARRQAVGGAINGKFYVVSGFGYNSYYGNIGATWNNEVFVPAGVCP